jgi:DNA-binding response OmpR family regulator
MPSMATNTTLLCIHCDPAPLSLLRANGYRVLTATNGHEGLQLFMTRQVDAIVLEYHLGFLDGGIVAAEIKKTHPQIPILMVVDRSDVPEGALRSVDMVVAKLDGDHFLLSAIRSVLEPKPLSPDKTRKSGRRRAASRRSTPSRTADLKPTARHSNVPFSSEEWQNILNRTVKFGSDA